VTEVFAPSNAKQVAEVIVDAAAAGTTLDVRGGASKVDYGRPVDADAILDVSALSGVGLYEPEELVITVGAGTPMMEIQATLADANQHLAFEPPDYDYVLGRAGGGATIGGVVACNLSGPRRIGAGAARDHILGIAAISGRGDAFKSGGRVVKNVTGYDLSKLMAGSMGTLGVMTEITLKTLPSPEETRTVLAFGLDVTGGLGVLQRAAGSQAEVTGMAYLSSGSATGSSVGASQSVTALRLEGSGPSVAARGKALSESLSVSKVEILDREGSLTLWAEIRDCKMLRQTGYLWRISVPPASGAEVAMRIGASCDAEFLFDWAGGLIWVVVDGDDSHPEDIRNALVGASGHATLVRASKDTRREISVFQPQPEPLADLSGRINEAFDPHGILNPGRMVAGQ
jgi:glycolate oxidase FAD binding subunit